MTPDVNVLVAASRSDHPHHRIARSWLEDTASAAASGGTLILMPMVLASFLRLVCWRALKTDQETGFLLTEN
jgi:predicted nucleic acid-binding protein